ncbi:amidase [Thalassolituus maritimus]|uniref:Amidase n=1 Tax=Thalassolituus maritimus TaxID=484498 RepID=A0ABQ0A074_9GAMM
MSQEWAYSTVGELSEALASGQVTSRGLVEYFKNRIDTLNPALNAVVATDYDSALSRADEADAARARGESWGPLHGIPMTIKDTFEVIGMHCTAGSRSLAKHMPKSNAFTVDLLVEAGAIPFGKTNVPLFAGDLQSYNKVYGTTNNPRNTECTPGGSSGGAAAALAAGFTPIELGSDLAGSIRTPSHFCGTYGHKPTHGIIASRGHIPGPSGMLMEPDLATPGPMARCAQDLDTLLDVLAVPGPHMGENWSLSLPAAPDKALSDYKVLIWTEDPMSPIDDELKCAYSDMATHLKEQGVDVTIGAPTGFSLESFVPTYMNLLGSVLSGTVKPSQRPIMAALSRLTKTFGKKLKLSAHIDKLLKGMTQAHADWQMNHEKRLQIAKKADKLFDQYDVILTPVVHVPAFKHQSKPPMHKRKLPVNGVPGPYTDIFMWIAPATLMGLPATSAPVGETKDGLPVNVQVLGRKYHDKTTIRFAALLEKSYRGFTKPEGY